MGKEHPTIQCPPPEYPEEQFVYNVVTMALSRFPVAVGDRCSLLNRRSFVCLLCLWRKCNWGLYNSDLRSYYPPITWSLIRTRPPDYPDLGHPHKRICLSTW